MYSYVDIIFLQKIMKKPTIIFAWWWTWWHALPIMSLLQYIDKNPEYADKLWAIYRAWSTHWLEKKLFDETPLLNISPVFINVISGKFRRETLIKSFIKNIRDMCIFFAGIFYALYVLVRHRVDIIFCKGWYIALPIVFAGVMLRKKIYVHESDVKAWLTNKIAHSFADHSFTAFPDVFNDGQIIGQILSDDIIYNPEDTPEHIISNIDKNKTNILVTWWSQWSQKLYNALRTTLLTNPTLQEYFHFHVIAGYTSNDTKQLFTWFKSVTTYEFLSQYEMSGLYQYCDIAITRAGTTSLAEQKLYDMKLFIVPIPRTHDQYQNAEWYEHKYQDIFIDQKGDWFTETIDLILQQHVWYHKKPRHKDIVSIINQPKEVIIKKLLE